MKFKKSASKFQESGIGYKMQGIRYLLGVICFFVPFLFSLSAKAQNTATVFGTIKDDKNIILEHANVAVLGNPGGATTDKNGYFELTVPADKKITIAVSYVGMQTFKKEVSLKQGERYELKEPMKSSSTELGSVEVEDQESRKSSMTRLDPKLASVIVTPGSGIESLLKTLPGVSSNNELSSQYSVRGGNYDENLVYVNDVEIYRPFLVRSGQQEGLSFANSDMVSSLLFSAGGFDAKYGDKMSSVLDIQYRKPAKFKGSASGGLLGGSLFVEGCSNNHRLTYQLGVRQKSNQYILKQLDTQGDYKPSFTDIQSSITYDVSEKFELNFLGSFARNKYLFKPSTRVTNLGTVTQALQLTIDFDGQELDNFRTSIAALSGTYRPDKKTKLKFISSIFNSVESQDYDIQGQYRIDELETDFGKSTFGKVKYNRGIGTFINHSRDELNALVYNFEHKGTKSKGQHFIQWGARYQREQILDKISEWNLNDSTGYSVPLTSSTSWQQNNTTGFSTPQANNDDLNLNYHLKSKADLGSNRISGFIQDKLNFSDTSIYSLTAGIRFSYWDLNKQFLVSPRANFSIKPKWEHDYLFRFSAGYYYQPPFYREMRDFNGNINKNLKAQTSIHFVAGTDLNFKIWNRPFKFTGEVYYKYLDNLVPYEIDNVRLRYFAQNSATGYAGGIDLKLHGEFVKGIESWASLSVMKTAENIKNDFYYDYYNKSGQKIIQGYTEDTRKIDSVRHEPGYIPRPTDQRVNFGLFFQDYVPRFPSFKMHLNLLFGSGMPFGPPNHNRFQQILRIPPYRRVDIGFSKQLLAEGQSLGPRNPFRFFDNIWMSVDVFNLLGIKNTVSYLWVQDVTQRLYAVPNYLSVRQLNVRLQFSF